VLHDEQPFKDTPTPEQILGFRERYRPIYLANSDAELAKLLPRTLSTAPMREPVLEEISAYLHQRNAHNFPEFTIQVEFVSWQGAFRVLDDLLRHPVSSPDLLTMPTTWCTHFIEAHFLESLDGLLQVNHTSLAHLYEAEVLRPCRQPSSEAIYGLPGVMDTRFLYLWKGIKHPISGTIDRVINDPHAIVQNAITFREALRTLPDTFNAKIQAINHDIQRYNTAHGDHRPPIPEIHKALVLPNAPQDWGKLHNFAMFVWLFGGDLFAPKWGLWHEARFNNPAVVDYLLTLAPYTDILEIQMPQAEQRFLEQQYLFHIGVPTTLARTREELGEAWNQLIEVLPFPTGPRGKRATFLGGIHWAITAQAVQRGTRDIAWDLLQFLAMNTEAQVRYALGIGYLPATKEAFQALIHQQPEYALFASALAADGKGFPRLAAWGNLVENEFTLDQLTQFWRYVGFGRQDGARMTLERAAVWLTDELFWHPMWWWAKWGSLGVLLVVLGFMCAKWLVERQRLLAQLRHVQIALQRAYAEREALQQRAHLTMIELKISPATEQPKVEANYTQIQSQMGRHESFITGLVATEQQLRQRLRFAPPITLN